MTIKDKTEYLDLLCLIAQAKQEGKEKELLRDAEEVVRIIKEQIKR